MQFVETLRLRSQQSHTSLQLAARGVRPKLQLSAERVLDVGAVLAGEWVERAVRLENQSSFPLDFRVALDSAAPDRYRRQQLVPAFVVRQRSVSLVARRTPTSMAMATGAGGASPQAQSPRRVSQHHRSGSHESLGTSRRAETEGPQMQRHWVGTQNLNGQCVFDCVPRSGTIPPGTLCPTVNSPFSLPLPCRRATRESSLRPPLRLALFHTSTVRVCSAQASSASSR